jgi:SAM-dependent methyltransferase
MKQFKTNQATITMRRGRVFKQYNSAYANKEAVDHELAMLHVAASNGIPVVKARRIGDFAYSMLNAGIGLGNSHGFNKLDVTNMLFYISPDEFIELLDGLEKGLEAAGIKHCDINPGNVIFDPFFKQLRLCDFYWAEKAGEGRRKPKTLNPVYGRDDAIAFQRMREDFNDMAQSFVGKFMKCVAELRDNIGDVYRDGSSTQRGKIYHPINFPGMPQLRCHKRAVVQEHASIVRDLIKHPPRTVADIGCAAGYNIFNLMRLFPSIEMAAGVEADPHMLKFLRDVKRLYSRGDMYFTDRIDHVFERHWDVIVMMNVHMWIHKQMGEEKTRAIMHDLIDNCDFMYFQTAGAESSGMYKVKSLDSEDAVATYLSECGASSIKRLKTVKQHGGKRYLFRVS